MITLAQISTNLINKASDDESLQSEYYRSIWEKKADDGYVKPDDYWEIPLWMARVSGILKHNNMRHEKLVMTEVNHSFAPRWAVNARCEPVMFSVLDSNKEIILNIVKNNPNQIFWLGGYVDWKAFRWYNNVKIFKSVEDWCQQMNLEYTTNISYHLFHGEKCIPRLTLSTGCKYRCKFCTIPNQVIEVPGDQIMQQLDQIIEHLDFRLIYIDDKTFGQCKNYSFLADLSDAIEISGIASFKGFIVQTTASVAMKKDFRGLNIFAAEIGIESYNDDILKRYKKPATERIIRNAIKSLVQQGINVIPNIIVGFPEETSVTYAKTYNLVEENRDDIYIANIYNLAIYNEAELSSEVIHTDDDANEAVIDKSFSSPQKRKLDEAFSEMLFSNVLTIL